MISTCIQPEGLGLGGLTYHQQVVEQEDLPLVNAAPLRSVRVGNLEQLTAAHEPAMRQRQHLRGPNGTTR